MQYENSGNCQTCTWATTMSAMVSNLHVESACAFALAVPVSSRFQPTAAPICCVHLDTACSGHKMLLHPTASRQAVVLQVNRVEEVGNLAMGKAACEPARPEIGMGDMRQSSAASAIWLTSLVNPCRPRRRCGFKCSQDWGHLLQLQHEFGHQQAECKHSLQDPVFSRPQRGFGGIWGALHACAPAGP